MNRAPTAAQWRALATWLGVLLVGAMLRRAELAAAIVAGPLVLLAWGAAVAVGQRLPQRRGGWVGWGASLAPAAVVAGPAGVVAAAGLLAAALGGVQPATWVAWLLLAVTQLPWPAAATDVAVVGVLTVAVAAAAGLRVGELRRLRRSIAAGHERDEARARRMLARGLSDSVEGLTAAAVERRGAERQAQLGGRLQEVVITVRRALGAHTAMLYLRRPDEHLELAAFDSVDADPELARKLHGSEGVIGWVFRHAEPFLAQEYAKAISGLNHMHRARPVRSFLAVPVQHHGCLGVLAVDSLEVQAFQAEEHRQLLGVMAAQTVHWLEDAERRADAEEELEQWRAFFAVAHRLQEVSELQGAAEFFLDLVDMVVQPDLAVLIEGRPGGRAFQVVDVRGGDERIRPGWAFAADESWTGWALGQPGARGVADLARRRTSLPLLFQDDGVPLDGSVLCIPFAAAGEGSEVAGGLLLWHHRAERFDTAVTAILARLIAPFQLAYGRARATEALSRLATTDGLTGLMNRRVAMERLDAELKRSDRGGRPTAVVLLDVDRFKGVNDTYGHNAGDAVLRVVASLLRKSVRDVDLAARYGGEEFLLILGESERAGALKLAERVRKELARTKVAIDDGRTLKVTASFGVAIYAPQSAEPRDALLKRADEALYAAKEGGRNRVVVAQELAANAV